MFSEDQLLPISALQHLLFCERQCALIHVERLWVENRLTAEGQQLHKKAHDGKPESRDGVRITRGLPLHSLNLGLAGQADVIEWEPPSVRLGTTLAAAIRTATSVERHRWRITPVEYKRGKSKHNDCDRVQLCAQAICLEEMLDVSIPSGAIFYGEPRRREPVDFSPELRETTANAARRLHQIIDGRLTPPAVKTKMCENCSLVHLCLPNVTSHTRSAKAWIEKILDAT